MGQFDLLGPSTGLSWASLSRLLPGSADFSLISSGLEVVTALLLLTLGGGAGSFAFSTLTPSHKSPCVSKPVLLF